MRCVIYLILVLLFTSCDFSNNPLFEAYYWNNKEILLETKMEVKVFGKDTIINHCDDDYKLLVYVSSRGCVSCNLNLFDWKVFLDNLQIQHNNIEPWFVVSSANYRLFELMCKANRFNYPIYYDRKEEFAKTNEFNLNKTMTIFLLDSLNRVKVVGDPVRNKNIFKLYGEVMNGDLKE